MTTAWTEGKRGFYFATQARLIENDRECAWAEKFVKQNPAHAWVVGRYAEADHANENRQYFQLDGLRMAQPTIQHAPMNINHEQSHIVGSFVATELVYPTESAGAAANPYIEALGVVWRAYFPQEYKLIQKAHSEGRLYYSMECVPKQMACSGDGGCGEIFDYQGIQSPSYCAHLNERSSDRDLLEPHFTGGALIIPPVLPGWSGADVHSLVAAHATAADERVAVEAAHEMKENEDMARNMTVVEWETQMEALQLIEDARTFNADKRKNDAKTGAALPDGSFPIENVGDLQNAIKAIGRAKDPAKAKAHIRKRAAALGATKMLPAGW